MAPMRSDKLALTRTSSLPCSSFASLAPRAALSVSMAFESITNTWRNNTMTARPTATIKTRTRVSPYQKAALEEAYNQASHPPRDVREQLSRALNMELRAVTIWFQNKRQTEKKRLTDAGFPSSDIPVLVTSIPNPPSTPVKNRRAKLGRTVSLDYFASMSETRAAQQCITTPPRTAGRNQLWNHMDSSPVQQENSPQLDRKRFQLFGKSTSLEWACAKARLEPPKEEEDVPQFSIPMDLTGSDTDTDDDTELMTPDSSVIFEDIPQDEHQKCNIRQEPSVQDIHEVAAILAGMRRQDGF